MIHKLIRLGLPIVLLAVVSTTHAYNGRTTVTKRTEKEHGAHFEVAFQDHEGVLQVTITAPQKVKSLSLSAFPLAQVDDNGTTTLRVPISSTNWKVTPDIPSRDGKRRSQLTVARGFHPTVTLSVSPQKLSVTELEARYGGFDSSWTYSVNLSSYQSKTKPVLLRETTIKEADRASMLTEALGIEKLNSATVIHSPHGFSNHRGRATAFVTDQKTLAALHKVLEKLPAQGGVFKQWPEDIRHRRIYLHANDRKVISLDVYGHSLQSPLDATFSASEDDPRNTELMKLLEGIDRNWQSQRFRDRRGPLSKPRKSNWRPADRDRDRIMAAAKAFDSKAPPVGAPKDWQWNEAEVYVDGQGNYLLWVFYRSRNRDEVWRWTELDSEAKRIHASGWGEG